MDDSDRGECGPVLPRGTVAGNGALPPPAPPEGRRRSSHRGDLCCNQTPPFPRCLSRLLVLSRRFSRTCGGRRGGERKAGAGTGTSDARRLEKLVEEAREVARQIRRRQQTELAVLAELEETLSRHTEETPRDD